MSEPFDDDVEALDVLAEFGVTHDRGLIRLRRDQKDPRPLNAVDYLCEEWDYDLEWTVE